MRNYNILRTYCEKIFLIGSGNFWFENDTIGDDKSLFYRAYNTLLFFMYGLMTILEIMAALMGEFPEDEKRDSVTFAVSHTIVMIKILSVVLNKSLIRRMNQKMISACERYETPSLMADKFRIMKINVIAYFATVYGSCFFFVFEGLRKLFDDSHFVTIVTYYPAYEDDSVIATVFRVFTTGILFVMMLSMILTVDSFTMVYLIMYKYKFITLRIYFENLRADIDNLNKLGKKILAVEKLTKGLVEGIVMHNEVLRLSKEIDAAFGTVIALQVLQSSGSAVSLLLQIAVSII
ncbi:Odorant receptor 22 [Operophtera brumata]|uniref:Odorant receptor 22 n=1 Tax=Operophtera brumata TaxID=104452 RepID=A0A0L7KUG2_OPEBR|nr:Odorant receptor 22 [Operophtera brumata]